MKQKKIGKTCIKCSQTKDIGDFYKNCPICKPCKKVIDKAWHDAKKLKNQQLGKIVSKPIKLPKQKVVELEPEVEFF